MTAVRAKPGQVLGFCYVTGKPLAMTPKEWRDKYPPPKYRRKVEDGETFYTPKWDRAPAPTLAAEAYAIIPAGRAS